MGHMRIKWHELGREGGGGGGEGMHTVVDPTTFWPCQTLGTYTQLLPLLVCITPPLPHSTPTPTPTLELVQT